MEQVTIIQKPTFDFEANRVEVMDLATLRRTVKETDIYGNPLRGFHHFEVIERIEQMCLRYNLNFQTEDIFAAQNKNRTMPGAVLLPKEEAKYGPRAVEAHILRRIYTTIRIRNYETDELTTTLAVAYHQEGIQAAIGPCVVVCHNQCILRPESMVSDYGKNKVPTEQLFDVIDDWLSNFETHTAADHARIRRLRATPISEQELLACIGLLTAMRVAHDSEERALSSRAPLYPLNQSQITQFTEDVLKLQLSKPRLTAWDLYNVATELYKPEKADFPTLIPQNYALVHTLDEFCQRQAV